MRVINNVNIFIHQRLRRNNDVVVAKWIAYFDFQKAQYSKNNEKLLRLNCRSNIGTNLVGGAMTRVSRSVAERIEKNNGLQIK